MMNIQKLRAMNLHAVADELEELRAYKEVVENQKPVGYAHPKAIEKMKQYSHEKLIFTNKANKKATDVALYTVPVLADKPARITEQDVLEIMNTYIDNKIGVPVNEWLKPLLNKLNADREPDYEAMEREHFGDSELKTGIYADEASSLEPTEEMIVAGHTEAAYCACPINRGTLARVYKAMRKAEPAVAVPDEI